LTASEGGETSDEDDADADADETGDDGTSGDDDEGSDDPTAGDESSADSASAEDSNDEGDDSPSEDSGSSPTAFINEDGRVESGSNEFGIQGDWYVFSDGVTSDQSGNPYVDGAYCFTGQAPGDQDHGAHWGVGLGLDFNLVDGEKEAYEFEGKLNGFRMRLVGSAPTTPRLQFVNDLEADVTPFTLVTFDETLDYWVADAQVPFDWGVDNAGQRVDNGILYSLQILASGSNAEGPIDVCLTEFEPIYDPDHTGGEVTGGPYINSDGFMHAEENAFEIQGPVYAISDGVSSTQSGNPYEEGKYCVAGEFVGGDENWGAGIAFDLNRAPGEDRQPYLHDGKIEGFSIALSGSSPGNLRVQFVTNESQEGNQPFLAAQLNTTMRYRIDWAQVPTSWDVEDAGKEVDDAIYTLQVYLEGDKPGPFEVCVEEFLPGTASDLGIDAEPAEGSYNGSRTVDPAILVREYELWKAARFLDCDDGTACVPRDEGDCISEGVAYGMLLAVGFDDQDAFDKLWAYYEKHKNSNGVMNWQTDACGAVTSSGSASDGELDAAMALIQAGCKWGGTYESEASDLIAAIRNSEVTLCNDLTVLKPGDNFGGCNEANPSYFAPAYYRIFETMTGDSTWGDLIDDGYTWLATLQAQKDGLVPDWADAAGTPQSGERGDYGPDASRTPWRIATDYVWNDEPRAVTFLDNVSAHVDGNGGVQRLFTPNSNFRGGVALSGLHQSPAKAQEYTDAWLTTAADDGSYFPGTLRPIYLMLAAHQFPKDCN